MGYRGPGAVLGRESFSPDASYYRRPAPRRTRWTSSRGRRRWLSRSAARAITATPPRRRWRRNGPTTSRRARRSSGTLTPGQVRPGLSRRLAGSADRLRARPGGRRRAGRPGLADRGRSHLRVKSWITTPSPPRVGLLAGVGEPGGGGGSKGEAGDLGGASVADRVLAADPLADVEQRAGRTGRSRGRSGGCSGWASGSGRGRAGGSGRRGCGRPGPARPPSRRPGGTGRGVAQQDPEVGVGLAA